MSSSDKKRPLVAVSAVPRSLETGYGPDLGDTVAAGLVKGVLQAGGVPIILPVVPPQLAPAQLAHMDALILSGGQDVNIELSPEELARQPLPRWLDPARDAHEQGLWDEAKRRRLPTLAICRGTQLINHLEGGELHTHVDSHDAGDAHAQKKHGVEIAAGSLLEKAIGATNALVNTIHHQAVKAPAETLKATAHADDGTIEAVEWKDPETSGWLLGVQWHPELMLEEPAGQRLFDSLVSATSRSQ